MPLIFKFVLSHKKNFSLFCIVLSLYGCGTMKSGRGWGEDVTPWPGLDRIKHAAVEAAKDTYTWVPAASAALVWAGGWDHSISDWASERTPVFGSRFNALEMSDTLRRVSFVSLYASVLVTPSGDTLAEIIPAKLKGAALTVIATSLTGGMTSVLKRATLRERPDGSDRHSFPSGHSSTSFVAMGLAQENIEVIPINNYLKKTMDYGLLAASAGTAWARVESKVHYPTDVLAGAALGNFMARFFYKAFLGTETESKVTVWPLWDHK